MSSSRLASGPRAASLAEQWLFLAHQAQPDAPAFNVTSSFRVSGTLDVLRFERAIRTLVARHEGLRSAFTLVDGGVRVDVHAQVDVPLVVVACIDADDQRSRAEAIARDPFDAKRPPLIRWAYLTAPGVEPLLLLAGSDLVLDHWSVGLVWTEIGTLYTADGDARALPPFRAHYREVAASQQQLMASGALQIPNPVLDGPPARPASAAATADRPTLSEQADLQRPAATGPHFS